MNKISLSAIFIISIFNFSFSQYEISIGQYNADNQTIEILLDNEEAIGGFQFQITGLNLLEAFGGSAEQAGFSVSTSEIGVVLGFSFSGAIIPEGNSILTNLIFESINNQFTEITNITISSPSGVTVNSNSSGIIDHGPPFCDGNWDSYAQLDECNICNGPGLIYECGCNDLINNECDCDGNILDDCGICGGDNSSCYYSLSLENFNINNQTVDIIISNPEPILGFQFNITGINMISASGGLAEDNAFSTSVGGGVVLGFSFLGEIIPISQNEILTTINFSEIIDSSTMIENIILSDTNASTIPNVDAIGYINHGEPNCAGNYYSFDDTNDYGCCFDQIPDCLGLCNGNTIIDDCDVCNGDGYSCLECFEFDEFDCTTSPFCDWETDSIDCSDLSSSSQCNAIDECNWVSGGGGGGGYGSNENDEHNEQNNNSNNRGYCDGGIIEIDAFCINLTCSELDELNCDISSECQWLNSTTEIECINLPENYCNNSLGCEWITSEEDGYYIGVEYCSGDLTYINNNSCVDLIIPGCMIDIATNFNPNANTDDGSCIFPPLGILSLEELDLWTGTLEVHLDCEYPVSEFLIDISGLNMTGCFGGASENAGFNIEINDNIITGISTGEYIPEHSGLLMTLTFDNIINENICYENSWITTSANIEYEAILDECVYVNLGCTDIYSLDYEESAEYNNGTCNYADNIIEAGSFYYSPSEINIDIGESIQWNNLEGFHSVNGINSTLDGESFNNPEDFYLSGSGLGIIGSKIFNIAGIYEYDCDIGNHAEQGMIASITVGEGGCMNNLACNYNESFDFQYGECEFPEENHDCIGQCLLNIDNCGVCGGQGSTGDVNENNSIDIADITYIIEYIIGEIIFDDNLACTGDVNMNGILNVTDVVMIIELILSE